MRPIGHKAHFLYILLCNVTQTIFEIKLMYTIYIGRTLIKNIFKAMLKIISLIFTMTKMIKSVILIPMRI